MLGVLLSITFLCGVAIAGLHVANRRFVAPIYDCILNLTAFAAAVASSALLQEWAPLALAAVALLCWCWLSRRTWLHRRAR